MGGTATQSASDSKDQSQEHLAKILQMVMNLVQLLSPSAMESRLKLLSILLEVIEVRLDLLLGIEVVCRFFPDCLGRVFWRIRYLGRYVLHVLTMLQSEWLSPTHKLTK